jgi:hypothetical protein
MRKIGRARDPCVAEFMCVILRGTLSYSAGRIHTAAGRPGFVNFP